jgi:hypothetical protein
VVVVVVVMPGGSVVVVVGPLVVVVVVVIGGDVVVVVGPLVVVVVVGAGVVVVVVVVVGGPTLVSKTETDIDTVGTTPFKVKTNVSVPSHVLSSLKKKVADAVLLSTVNVPPSPEIFASAVLMPVIV